MGIRVIMEHNDITSINERLDLIISILMNQTKIQEETTKEKIARLVSFGFENPEIAKILNTTTAVVAQERYMMKKGKKSK